MRITQETELKADGAEYVYWIGNKPTDLDGIIEYLGLPTDVGAPREAERLIEAHTPEGTTLDDGVSMFLEERLSGTTVLWEGIDSVAGVDWEGGRWLSALAVSRWDICPRSVRELPLAFDEVFVGGTYDAPLFVVRGGGMG